MFFDPVSTWLVALIADGIMVADEKNRGGTASEYSQKVVKQHNEMLNADIRRIKSKYGLVLAEMAYDQIKLHIKITKDNVSFRHANGQVVIDLDNQEYIIAVLEECARYYSKYDSLEEYRQKSVWYRNAASEARRRKELYEKELEVVRIRATEQQKKDQTLSIVCFGVGLTILIGFIAILLGT